MASQYVLDAYALLALLTDEAGSEQVAEVLENLDSSVYISALNVGEVYYILRRQRGMASARDAEKAIFAQPNLNVVVPNWEQIRAAADLKSDGGLSFADAFAAALASELAAPLLTGDPEFAELEQRGIIQILWLRRGMLTYMAFLIVAHDLLQVLDKHRHFMGEDLPEDLQVYTVVTMDQSITETDNLCPGDLAVLILDVGRNVVRRFTDNLAQPRKCQVQEAVFDEIASASVLNQCDRFASVIEHVTQAEKGITPGHKRLRL